MDTCVETLASTAAIEESDRSVCEIDDILPFSQTSCRLNTEAESESKGTERKAFGDLLGQSTALLQIAEGIEVVAPTDGRC